MIIVLMGYMASGKSFIGKVLAKKMSYDFIDLDAYIELREGKTIKDIFESLGEIYFRKIETQYLNEVLDSKTNIVLSLGGGTPCYGNNLGIIKNNSKVISFYLNTSINTIASRLENEKSHRPLVARFKSKEELQEFIGKHLFERSYFYNQADFLIKNDNVFIDDVVESIVIKLF